MLLTWYRLSLKRHGVSDEIICEALSDEATQQQLVTAAFLCYK
ncbi:hypothetical protein [Nostoc sp. ChiVER01]|nr:hypothetical protein [Nostoc sp. ChiVER01]MDZ8223132.1 hypothetical protein [Nostoc sp. ChiVER01]